MLCYSLFSVVKCCYADVVQTGNTALHLAAANGYSSIVCRLVSFGADVNIVNKVVQLAHFLH